jgi:hypothetical protein
MTQPLSKRGPPSLFTPRYSSTTTNSTSQISSSWSPQQHCYRTLLIALREAYYYDRAKLFWARHRLKVEMYKYRSLTDEAEIEQCVNIGNEVAKFINLHMKFSVQRIVDHNNAIQKLPVDEAKRFRQRYVEREEQHESWCKSRIKMIMRRRPPPPYPFC